jgi:hypothetical protein
MKKFSTAFALLSTVLLFLAGSVSFSQDYAPTVRSYYDGPSWELQADTGITCSPSPPGIIRDDGTYENGYRSVSTGDSTTMVHKMILGPGGATITAMCVAWTALAPSGNITFDLIVYDTTGPGGAPGNVPVARVNNVLGNAVGIFPLHTRYRFAVNWTLPNNAYYFGVRWNNNPILPFFSSADENSTNTMGPGYQRVTTTFPPTWVNITTAFPNWDNWSYRLEKSTNPPYFPDILYYKFENNPAPLLTPNCAIPGLGTNPAPITGLTLTSGGQFDSCLSGTGGTGSILTGWNCNLANNNWTISFWVSNLVDLNPTYLFGDAGSTSFRCFYGGAALPNNFLLRGPMTDILVACPMPGSHVFHIVYNGTNVLVYRNGVLLSTNPRTINMPTGTGFRVGGYNNTASSMSGKMDEFKIVRYAMSAAEITATWNTDLGGCGVIVGVNGSNTQIPETYKLSQNYPNPFNPSTQISFSLPKSGDVKLMVYDILGKEVEAVVNEFRTAGNYTVDFNATNLSSGVYFYTLRVNDFTETRKMLLVK